MSKRSRTTRAECVPTAQPSEAEPSPRDATTSCLGRKRAECVPTAQPSSEVTAAPKRSETESDEKRRVCGGGANKTICCIPGRKRGTVLPVPQPPFSAHPTPLCQSQAAGSGATQRRRRPVGRAERARAEPSPRDATTSCPGRNAKPLPYEKELDRPYHECSASSSKIIDSRCSGTHLVTATDAMTIPAPAEGSGPTTCVKPKNGCCRPRGPTRRPGQRQDAPRPTLFTAFCVGLPPPIRK